MYFIRNYYSNCQKFYSSLLSVQWSPHGHRAIVFSPAQHNVMNPILLFSLPPPLKQCLWSISEQKFYEAQLSPDSDIFYGD